MVDLAATPDGTLKAGAVRLGAGRVGHVGIHGAVSGTPMLSEPGPGTPMLTGPLRARP